MRIWLTFCQAGGFFNKDYREEHLLNEDEYVSF